MEVHAEVLGTLYKLAINGERDTPIWCISRHGQTAQEAEKNCEGYIPIMHDGSHDIFNNVVETQIRSFLPF